MNRFIYPFLLSYPLLGTAQETDMQELMKMSLFDPSLKNSDGSLGRRLGNAVGDYLVMSANLRYEDWLTKGTSVNLHLYNWFDQEIRYPTYTINNWENKGTLGWERSVMVTVGYEF